MIYKRLLGPCGKDHVDAGLNSLHKSWSVLLWCLDAADLERQPGRGALLNLTQ